MKAFQGDMKEGNDTVFTQIVDFTVGSEIKCFNNDKNMKFQLTLWQYYNS